MHTLPTSHPHAASGHAENFVYHFLDAIVRGAGHHIGYTFAGVVLAAMILVGLFVLYRRAYRR
jgi:hypothetical protein